ncbi:MAG: type VI secretion system tip protein VgrG [Polyangiaceae bacterium]|nr:type VI secretion system tip protein VgrG [Polyangiaceae bacterium]
MTLDADDTLVFRAKPLPPGALRVRRLRSREGISRLYRAELLVETSSRDHLDPEVIDALVGAPAYYAFGEDEALPVHGILREVALAGASAGGVLYRVTLVPRLWTLTRAFRSRVFQDLTVPRIVEQVLLGAGLERDDFALRIAAKHPAREYTVQYQESDLDFISRLMEYEGMFFFFEQAAHGEVAVVADGNQGAPALDPALVPFLPPGGARLAGARGVTDLSFRRRLVEQRIRLLDYNYRTPAVHLQAEAEADPAGAGERVVYGEHFKTPDDGARLAAIRAEERLARREVYAGRADHPGLHAGCRFTLEGHEHAPLDQEYLVTDLRRAADLAGREGDAAAPRPYRARFTAVPSRVAYRPPRDTPWPRIAGLLHARVDGVQRTSIDEHGRYKILLPFDSATPGTGRASRWMRMAQPLSGPSGKMHFPLEVGAEVLLGHIDGDPDRPILVASVPNHETPSPVVARNAMQSIIHTRNGIQMIFDDEAGST